MKDELEMSEADVLGEETSAQAAGAPRGNSLADMSRVPTTLQLISPL